MTALTKPRQLKPRVLSDAERDVLACMADLFETADQVTVSRSRVALVLDARKVDRLHELMDIAISDDGRDPSADDDNDPCDQEPWLGSANPVQCGLLKPDQLRWAAGACDDREADAGDEAEGDQI